MEKRYTNPSSTDAHFDLLFQGHSSLPDLRDHIPRVAHFVHTNGKPLTWLEWLAVRAAITNLGCGTVKIWAPVDTELEGEIWQRIQSMREVKVQRIFMPTSVYGHKFEEEDDAADVVRLKVLYEEGGIFLENDLIALKSSDDVIDAPATRATVMAKRINPEGVPNWMIMSKPESPFLRRWMEDYQEEKEWNALATYMPLELYRDHDPDLTVLGGHSWFYPLASDPDGDNMLKRLWFGKTWYDIDVSYGTHMWHWKDEIRQAIRPKTVRKIDTPLFCRLRKLFDNLDGDGYMALEWEKDPACKVVTIPDLKRENHRLFADYKMGGDKLDMKLLDSSGTNHHAWAPSGTTLEHGGRTTFRNISEGSYFVMPVPIGWDARVWTVRTELRMDRLSLPQSDNVGLFMIRMDKGDELLIQFRLDKKSAGPVLDVHWKSGRKAKDDEYRKNEEVSWVSGPGLMPITDKAHEITISYDRRDEGKIQLYIDGTPLANQSLPFVHSPKIGQEVWFNARDWDNLDTGFRGELHRFTMYADALQQIDIESTIMATSSSGSTTFGAGMPHASTASSPYFFFPVLLLMLFLTFTVKLFKTLRRDLEESVRMISGTAKTLARGNG